MNDFWSVVSEKKLKNLKKMHKITNYSLKNRGAWHPYFHNLGGGTPRNITQTFSANSCSGLKWVALPLKLCVFSYAEMWAWKNDYNLIMIFNELIAF